MTRLENARCEITTKAECVILSILETGFQFSPTCDADMWPGFRRMGYLRRDMRAVLAVLEKHGVIERKGDTLHWMLPVVPPVRFGGDV